MSRNAVTISALFSLPVLAASAPTYSVSQAGTVADRSYCYWFRVPPHWRLNPNNPVPLLFDLHFSGRAQAGQDLPDNAASISVVPGPASSERPRSLDEWIALRGKAYRPSGRRRIALPSVTGISQATQVAWTDAEDVDAGETVTHTVAVFYIFATLRSRLISSLRTRASMPNGSGRISPRS